MNKSNYYQEFITFLSDFVTPERTQRFADVLKYRTRHLTIVLENLYQPHNTSAVLRSCDCFGVQDVHIIENTNAFNVNPDIALGSSKWLNIHRYNLSDNNTPDCIAQLKQQGYRIAATSLHTDAIDISELDLSPRTALLFGTEKEGLTHTALSLADVHVKIPMYGFTESFNISVSAALSLFYLTGKLRKSDLKWQLTEAETYPILVSWYMNTIKNSDLLEQRFKNNYENK